MSSDDDTLKEVRAVIARFLGLRGMERLDAAIARNKQACQQVQGHLNSGEVVMLRLGGGSPRRKTEKVHKS